MRVIVEFAPWPAARADGQSKRDSSWCQDELPMTDGSEGVVMDGGQPASFSRRMKKRRDVAARPPADLVAVELAAPLTPAGAGVLAQTLLKHLLFIRQQIPMSVLIAPRAAAAHMNPVLISRFCARP